MSNVLVIHPDDRSTDFLKKIYDGKGYDVITNCKASVDELVNQIRSHDKIIMLGHGTPQGLLNPKYGGYLIGDAYAPLLAIKETVSIWCNSDAFFRKHNMHGFHTGMIISETTEQLWVLGDVYLDTKQQLANMEQFSEIVGSCIERSPEEMRDYILQHYTGKDKVTQFNRENIKVL